MAALSWLVKKMGRREKTAPVSREVEPTQVDAAELSRAQSAYVEGLRRLRGMHLDSDLEREAAADLGRSYQKRFGEAEFLRLQRLVMGRAATAEQRAPGAARELSNVAPDPRDEPPPNKESPNSGDAPASEDAPRAGQQPSEQVIDHVSPDPAPDSGPASSGSDDR
jgi:hypothetical protein